MKKLEESTTMQFIRRNTFGILLTLSTCVLLLAINAGVSAQDGGSSGQERQTTRTPTMSEAVYKKLLEAQELIEAKNYDQGLAVLNAMEAQPKLTSYEKAQIFNFFAYTYFTLERYQDALKYYNMVLAEPDNTDALKLNTLYTVAQLYFVIEDYRKAIETVNLWLQAAPEPTLNAYMLLGQAYYQLEQYKEALSPLLKASDLVRQRGETPREMLLLLLQNIYLQLDDYPKMIEVLRQLIVHYPKPDHWRSLGAAYSELEQYPKQMAILEMLYEGGYVTDGRSKLNLANLYLMHDAPYKAAVLMDKGIKEGEIEATERNLQLLAQSWTQSQEIQKSLEPLIKASQIAKDGNIHVRLAQTYIGLDRYEEAAEAVTAGLKLGGIDRPDQANLMLGMALFELQKFDAAKNAFANATRDDRSKKAAEDWMKYVESEQSRKEQLELSMQQRRS